eukprot:1731594-Lingulodinium_polyedra.AAC.1
MKRRQRRAVRRAAAAAQAGPATDPLQAIQQELFDLRQSLGFHAGGRPGGACPTAAAWACNA